MHRQPNEFVRLKCMYFGRANVCVWHVFRKSKWGFSTDDYRYTSYVIPRKSTKHIEVMYRRLRSIHCKKGRNHNGLWLLLQIVCKCILILLTMVKWKIAVPYGIQCGTLIIIFICHCQHRIALPLIALNCCHSMIFAPFGLIWFSSRWRQNKQRLRCVNLLFVNRRH